MGGEPYTSSRKSCQSHDGGGGACGGGCPPLRPDRRSPPPPSVKRCRWRGAMCGGWGVGVGSGLSSCSILPKWEQTQLTASFLTVNIAAPLRHGSGTRTPPPPPPPPPPPAGPCRSNSPASCDPTSTFHLHPNTPPSPECRRIFRRMRRHRVNRPTPEGRTGRADGFHCRRMDAWVYVTSSLGV